MLLQFKLKKDGVKLRKNEFLKGLKDGVPICLGYFSVAFAFGISTVGAGLSIIEAVLISMTNVTSAGQLAAVPIIVSGGTLLEMAASQLVINLRYALMSVSLSQKLDSGVTALHRAVIAFVNTDEVFAVASGQKGSLSRYYMYGLIITPYLGWSAGTLAGAVAGDVLPQIITSSLGIAIYGMFVAVVVPAAKKSGSTALCVVFAVAMSCMFHFIPALSKVPGGFVIIICASLASAVFAVIKPIDVSEKGAKENE